MAVRKLLDRSKAFINALQGSARWHGTTTVASGDSTAVVSASQVKSGVAVPLTSLGQTSVGSHADLVTRVTTIVDNTSFIVAVHNAVIDSQEIVYHIIEQ